VRPPHPDREPDDEYDKQNDFDTLARKSLRLCLAGLRIGWFDPVAEASQLPDDSRRALLLRLFGDRWAPFFVPDSLVQDQPDQPTLSMGNGSDSLLMSETRYRAAIHNLENASFGFYGGVSSLIE
jgi:hypothetical protein